MTKLFIFLIVFSSQVIADDTAVSPIILSGKAETVLTVLKQSILNEYPSANISPLNNQTGYTATFATFFSGKANLKLALAPMYTGNESSASAFQIHYAFSSEWSNGSSNIRDLRSQIIKVASSSGEVQILDNSSGYRSNFVQLKECFEVIKDDPDLIPISTHIRIGGNIKPTLEMFDDEKKPNAQEKKALSIWQSKRENCSNILEEQLRFFPNDGDARFALETSQLTNKLIVRLYRNEISFGSFNLEREELGKERQKMYAEIVAKKMEKDDAARIDSEERQRQHELERQKLEVEKQKAKALRDAANRPAPISTTNCTSQRVGNTVQTNCQ